MFVCVHTCAGVTAFAEELDRCSELVVMFTNKVVLFLLLCVCVCVWLGIGHTSDLFILQGFLCELHHSVY